MVNWIWLFLLVSGIAAAIYNGNVDIVTKAALEGAQKGVTVCIGLIAVMVFWLGMMKIGEKAGLLKLLASGMEPVVRRLFPDVPRDHPALGYIVSNMSANLFGLGNAATPMGIKAMQELQRLNPQADTATPAMCTLLAINTASITLIPTTMIAIRLQLDSAQPADIVGTTLLATALATIAAIVLDRWFRYNWRRKQLQMVKRT